MCIRDRIRTEQPRTEAVALTPVVAEQDETCVYVFGANVGAAPDAATAKLAKRVLQISVVLILLQAIIAVVYYVRDEPLALILITLCFSLAHPTCGIFGVMNKDRSLLCMFCGYGCIQCAADAITCVLCIVYAVSKSGKKRRDFAMLAAYYFVQGVIHYVVFYWGNKLYIHKGFDADLVAGYGPCELQCAADILGEDVAAVEHLAARGCRNEVNDDMFS